MFARVTVFDFPLYGSYNAWLVKMLTKNRVTSIQQLIKDIDVVPFHYIYLELLLNNYLILVRYKLYSIIESTKKPF